MKNKEKYNDKLLDMLVKGELFAVEKATYEPCYCGRIFCATQCLFGDINDIKFKSCVEARKHWLEAEYTEPPVDWSGIAVDTPILVKSRINGEWFKRYFAKFENGLVYAWSDGATSWSARDAMVDWQYAKLASENEGE